MSIIRAIEINHFKLKKDRNWDKTYWFVDLHSTVIKPNYQAGNIPKEFYPHAKEVLQMLTKLKDVCLCMYTCSHPHEIKLYKEYFAEHDIHFEYENRNPEVKTDLKGYGCYDDKPYINVLFEDKAGFDAESDWELVRNLLNENYGEA